MTDLIILFIMIFMAFSLVRGEIDTDSILYINTMPRGRHSTALAKIIAFACSTLIVTVLLYGGNLLFCNVMYGLGDLFAPIQSYYFLMRSTLKCNLLIYLCIFMFTKWAAVFVVGLWVMLACTLTRKAGGGYLLAIAFPIGCEVIRRLVPATSQANLIKYANITSLTQTNEILGNYRNLNILEQPIHLFTVETIAALAYLILFAYSFCLQLCRWQIRAKCSSAKSIHITKYRHTPSFFALETFKIYVGTGGALVMLVFIVVHSVFLYNTESYITPDEVYYRYYLKVMDGPPTQAKLDWLREQGEEFKPLLQLEAALKNGFIDAQSYENQLNMYAGMREKYIVFRQVTNEFMQVCQNPPQQMIYENAYKRLFGIAGQDNLVECLVVCISLCIFCSPVFANDKQTKMIRLITTTPLGRTHIVSTKLIICGCTAVGMGILSLLPGFIVLIRDYWFSAPTALIQSMPVFASAPIDIPVFVLIFLMLLLRIIGCLAIMLAVLGISEKIGNTVVSIIVSMILLCLPSLLALAGLDGLKWVGIFPLFNFAAMLTDSANFVPAFLYPCMWLMVGGFSIYWLYAKYPQKYYLE